MNLIIQNSSMVPIYEQIIEQIKKAIILGELAPDEPLPSVRGLANELRISALTVKKAYDNLEQDGYVKTIHGKGTFVLPTNPELMKETKQKEIEDELVAVMSKAVLSGMTKEQMVELFQIVLEEQYD